MWYHSFQKWPLTVPFLPCSGLEELLLERIFGSQEAASSRPRSGPESRVGTRCRVYFDGDDDWYEAVIRGYDRQTKLHNVWYPYDEEVTTSTSLAEGREGLLTSVTRSKSSAAGYC